MDEFEQHDSEKETIDSHNTCYKNADKKRKFFHNKLYMLFILFCLCYETRGKYAFSVGLQKQTRA